MIILILTQLIWGFLLWKISRRLYEYSYFDEDERIRFPLILVILFWICQLIPVIGAIFNLVSSVLLIFSLVTEDVYYKYSKLGLKIKNFLFKQI